MRVQARGIRRSSDARGAGPWAAAKPARVEAVPAARAAPAQPAFELHVETVVLHGFSPADGRRAARALRAELVRLARRAAHDASGLAPSIAARIDAGTIELGPPEQTGARAARALFGGLRP